MFLTIVLRKEVETAEQGQTIANLVKTRLEDRPEVSITASVSENLPLEEPT